MKKKILLYAITTLFIFSITQVFSGESNISVWLSDLSVYYKGEKIEFTDANGNPCDAFIYNGITYVPLRSIAETMDKEVYWNSSEKSVNIEDEPIIDEIIIKRGAYRITADLLGEDEEKALESFDESVMTLKSNSDGVYKIEIDYFEPIPEIEVKTNGDCSAKVWAEDLKDLRYNIEIFNASGKSITNHTVLFKRRSFGEYIKNSSEFAKLPEEMIKKLNAYWSIRRGNEKVECYRINEDSWSTHAHSIGENGASTEILYDLPMVYEPEEVLFFQWNYPSYGVYTMKDGVEKRLYYVTKGDYVGVNEYARFDAKKTEHTVMIDYFEDVPHILVINNTDYEMRVTQATENNPVTLIKVYSVVNDRLVFEKEHKITFKRRSMKESLESRGVSLEEVESAGEIYSKIWFAPERYIDCKKDENGVWSAQMHMYGNTYPVDAPDI